MSDRVNSNEINETPAGAITEHSQDFQETFEAEKDDNKSNLHAEYCSTNRQIDFYLRKNEERPEKVIQMNDPLTHFFFEINASQLSQRLQKNEIKQIKDKFCMAKTLPYVTQEDVQMLQNVGVQIVSVTNRDPQPSHTTNSRSQEYKCIICEG